MNHYRIQKSTINILKKFHEIDLDDFGKMILEQFKLLISRYTIKNILISNNSKFEPNIIHIINFCLDERINVYMISRNNSNKLSFVEIKNQSFNIEFFQYTTQPIYKKNQNDFIDFDLILFPILSYDSQLNCCDYDIDLINDIYNDKRLIKTKKCAYAVCAQELSEIPKNIKSYNLDFVINEFLFLEKN
ncbi:MAG: hypothetical protein ACRC4L_01860 [Mycoplasma sp.]